MRTRRLLPLTALFAAVAIAVRADSLQTFHLWYNHLMRYLTRETLPLPYPAPPDAEKWRAMNPAGRLDNVRSRLLPGLPDELSARRLKLGLPAFIRIFKETRELELWLKGDDGRWKVFRDYPIATFSGTLGPKTREGDMQAPEGFYSLTPKQLNPASSYHLSFNVGYPNEYDLAHQRTGSLIMVHGDMVSVGCFAMTDPLIEEIYLVVEAALNNHAVVPVHIFPFRMTEARMQNAHGSPHLDFWQKLRPAFDCFETGRRVPHVTVENGSYRIH